MLSFNRKSLRTVLEKNAGREGAAFRVGMPATLPNILSPLPENIGTGFSRPRPDPNLNGRDDQPKE